MKGGLKLNYIDVKGLPKDATNLLQQLVNLLREKTESQETAIEALRATAGGWKNSIDTEQLKKDIYADRSINTRPVPKL